MTFWSLSVWFMDCHQTQYYQYCENSAHCHLYIVAHVLNFSYKTVLQEKKYTVPLTTDMFITVCEGEASLLFPSGLSKLLFKNTNECFKSSKVSFCKLLTAFCFLTLIKILCIVKQTHRLCLSVHCQCEEKNDSCSNQ